MPRRRVLRQHRAGDAWSTRTALLAALSQGTWRGPRSTCPPAGGRARNPLLGLPNVGSPRTSAGRPSRRSTAARDGGRRDRPPERRRGRPAHARRAAATRRWPSTLGTGSCRARGLRPRRPAISALGQREWTHPPRARRARLAVVRHRGQLAADCRLRARGDRSARPCRRPTSRGVSATSMREGMVLYDADGREIWACPNVDSRASAEAEQLVRPGATREASTRTAGDWVSITSPARFRWIRGHQPEVLRRRSRHLGMLSDWIATRLCGEYATDPSIGSSSGLFDLAEAHLVDGAARARRRRPRDRAAGGRVRHGDRHVTPAAAGETGPGRGHPGGRRRRRHPARPWSASAGSSRGWRRSSGARSGSTPACSTSP